MRLLALFVALALGLAIRWTTPSQVADLRPRPDALEYEESARNLANGYGYVLRIAGKIYPPRYPFGFPILLVPAVAVAKDTPGIGIWVVLASALAAIVAAWALAGAAAGTASATVAALFLAFSTAHVGSSMSVLSDVPASAAIAVLSVWVLSALHRNATVWEWLLLGLATGLAATMRPTIILVVVPVALCVVGWVRPAGSCVRRLLALAVGAVTGAMPLAGYQLARFGSPFASGYTFWGRHQFFGWRYAVAAPLHGGTAPNLEYYGRVLAGMGELYPWPIAILALLGGVDAARRGGCSAAFAVLTTGVVAGLLAVHGPYFYQSDRFFVPALPLVFALAALPFGVDRPVILRACAVGLGTLVAVLILRADDPYARPDARAAALAEVTTLREIDRLLEPDAVVLIHTDVFLFQRYLRNGTDRSWVPLGICPYLWRIKAFGLPAVGATGERNDWVLDVLSEPFSAARAEAALAALLREDRPVYFSTMLAFQVPFMSELRQLLSTRFSPRRVVSTGSWELFRLSELDQPPASPRAR